MKLRRLAATLIILAVAGSAFAAPAARKAKRNAPPSGSAGVKWWPGERPGQGANVGKVTAVGPDSITVATRAGQTRTYTVNAQTRIIVRGAKAALADIKVGDQVVVRCPQGQSVAKAVIVPKPIARGKVTAIDGNVITAADKAGTFTITVPETARIVCHRHYQGTLADIKLGYGIAAAGEMADNKMTAKHVTFIPPAVKGVVESRNGDTITVKTVKGKIITANTSDKTVVLIRPRTAPNELGKLADVKNGAPVNVGGHIAGENIMQAIYIDVLTGG